MHKRILLPLDGSSLAEQELPHAVAQAKCFQAELILLKVLEPLAKYHNISLEAAGRAEKTTHELAQEYLERIATGVREKSVSVRVITVDGNPHERIVSCAEAEQVDLIVICTRGHSGLTRWLMGSVADRVVPAQACRCCWYQHGRKRRKGCVPNKNLALNTPVLGTNMESQSGKIAYSE